MQSSIRLLVSVLVSLAFVSIPVSKQPSVVTASSPGNQRRAGRCFDVQQTDGDGSGAIQSPNALTFWPRSTARSPWEGIFGTRTPMFDTLLDPLPESFDGSAVFGLADETAPAVPRNPLAPAQVVDAVVINYQFTPDPIRIKAGDTVRWTWNASGHTVTSGTCPGGIYGCSADGAFCAPSDANCASNPTLSTGAVYSHTFSTPGTYPYYCRIHGESLGMTGTVIVDPAPLVSNVQLSAANYNVGEGDGSVTITVNRSGDTSGASTVDFATSDGTATQKGKYIIANGTLSFAAGETSKTFQVLIIDEGYVEGNQTFNVTLSNPTGATLAAPSTATVTIIDNDTASSTSPAPKRFAAALTGGQETPPNNSQAKGTGLVLLSQSETSALVGLLFSNLSSGETAAHIHGAAGPGVAAPILFPLPTTNLVTNFQISPTSQQVSDLKAGLHYQNVHSTNFANGEIRGQLLWNPTLEENHLVRQQYLDFLSREGDSSGFNFWVGTITPCQADAQCFHDKSIAVADAFFFEPEFHQTAGFVFLIYRAAYGNTQPFPLMDNSNQTEANKLPDYSVFVADRTRVVGGVNLTVSQQAFANLLVTRTEFTSRYPTATYPDGPTFVSAVLANIQMADGVDLSSQQAALVAQFNNAGGSNAGRGQVMYLLALDDAQNNPINNRAFVNAEYNRQFALTLYFGYLRRDPDIGGFLFWQSQINSAAVGNVPKQQALVCSFITSAEYQQRFGPNAPRTNAECPQ